MIKKPLKGLILSKPTKQLIIFEDISDLDKIWRRVLLLFPTLSSVLAKDVVERSHKENSVK